MLRVHGCSEVSDESCRKRFERIHLHTAAVPTLAPLVPARDEVLEVSEASADADASETPAGAVAEEAAAGPSSSGVKRGDDDNGPDDARSAKRATMTAEDTEMKNAERKRKDQAHDSFPGLESAVGVSAAAADPTSHRSSESKRGRVAARIEEAVEGAMQTGDVGVIMAVQEAIESDEVEQDEPDEIWGGKEWLDPRLVKEGRLDELRRLKHFDVFEVEGHRSSIGAKWSDRQKGSVVRSRIVARQFATKSLEHLFAGTPDDTVPTPSNLATDKDKGLLVADVTSAYNQAPVVIDQSVRPPTDQREASSGS